MSDSRSCAFWRTASILLRSSWAVGLAVLFWTPAVVRAESVSCQAADFYHDGDVDQEDFGILQACFSGRGVAQSDPNCLAARLDLDADVDADDLRFFLSCISGPATSIGTGRLRITELMAANQATIRDPDQVPDQYPDWIEIFNDDSEPVELGGLYLTNSLATPTQWQIPSGVRVEGGQRLLFWADAEPSQGPTHTGFTLDAAGQTVALVAADGQTVIDQVTFPALSTDVSYGRLPDITDRWRTFRAPDGPATPGQANGSLGIPAALTVESDLPVVAGHKYTTQNIAQLYGQCYLGEARSIRVNGLPAQWDPVAGTWKIGSTPMLISRGSAWHFFDQAPPAAAGWQTVASNDPWPEQNARLGYGGDGETQPPLGYGPNSSSKYMTAYFRRTFEVGDTSQYTGLTLRLLRDDGAAVYINGSKLPLSQTVDNMPDSFTYTTPASSTVDGTNEQTFFEQTGLSKTLLTPNATNVISAEVHQINGTSSDLSFDLELVAQGTGLTTGVTLTPGLNHVLVQAFDGPNGTGNEIERTSIDIIYDNMTQNVISGTLTANKTLTAALSPWHVTGDLTVPAGITLTVEPGVTVMLNANVRVVVNGVINAVGSTGNRIRFTRAAGSSSDWGGFSFTNNHNANTFAYCDFEWANGYGNNRSAIIYISQSRVTFERDTFLNVMGHQILDIWYPQVTISHSVFGDVGSAYMIEVENLAADGWFIVDANLFGTNTGDADIFHLNHISVKNGPKAIVTRNVFLGTGDDQIDDNESDSHIEGNLFLNSITSHPERSAACAVTTGEGSGNGANLHTQRLVVVRNVFWGNDYAIINKDGSAVEIYNCVFVGNRGGIILDEPWRTDSGPGRSCYVESCIFWNNLPENGADQGAFAYYHDPEALTTGRYYRGYQQVTVNNSIIASQWHSLGTGNIEADPMFTWPNNPLTISPNDPEFANGFDGFDFDSFLVTNHLVPDASLLPGSPAIGTGFNGTDMGMFVSGGATITGEPSSPTSQTTASLTVAGLDIDCYKYRVIGPGFSPDWSPEIQQWKYVPAITLSGTTATATCNGHGFANGDMIEVKGADSLCPYYNGLFTIQNVTANTFNYTVSPAAGDLLTNEPLSIVWPIRNEGITDIWCRKPQKIELSGLTAGTYRVEVIRKNSMDVWQDEAAPTVSKSWTVDTTP